MPCRNQYLYHRKECDATTIARHSSQSSRDQIGLDEGDNCHNSAMVEDRRLYTVVVHKGWSVYQHKVVAYIPGPIESAFHIGGRHIADRIAPVLKTNRRHQQ